MDKEIRNKILGLLVSIKARPAMYFGADDDVKCARAYFDGYNAAVFALGGETSLPSRQTYWAVIEERDWEIRATFVATEMRENSFSEKEIVAELIEIELEAWRRLMPPEQN